MVQIYPLKGAKVDLILENRKKQLYGIEVKSASLKEKDFSGLKRLPNSLRINFRKGLFFILVNRY